MTDQTPQNFKAVDQGGENTAPKTSDTAKQDAVIAGQPNQEVHGQAFSVTHANDIQPSDPSLIAAKDGETLEEYRARVAAIKENAFGFMGELTPEDLGKKPSKHPAEEILIASKITPNVPHLEPMQQYQDIQSNSDLSLIAKDPTEIEQSGSKKEKPTVGKSAAVQEFLKMDSPIADAYHTGKSKTLGGLVAEMGKRPWTIYAMFENSATFQDYDAKDSTIRLGTKWTNEKKIDSFAHEAYHATHQDLDKLYGADHPIKKEDYMQIKMDQEAGSFLAEYKTNREFGHTPGTSYEYADGSEVKSKNIGDLIVYRDKEKTVIDEQASRAAIGSFLRTHHAPRRNQNGWPERDSFTGEIKTTPYPKQHEEGFTQYVNNFTTNRSMLVHNGWLGKGY